MTINRRSFLRGSGAAAVAVAAAGLLGTAGAGPAAAATTPFPIGGSDTALFTKQELSFYGGWQSFAYAPINKFFLYAQPSPSSGHGNGITSGKEHGDVRVSSITASGTVDKDKYLQLSGFGHVGSLGVEPRETYDYLWMGTNGTPYKDGTNSSSRSIAYLRWQHGEDRPTYNVSDLGTSKLKYSELFTLQPGSLDNDVTYDPTTHRLLLRYTRSGTSYYAIYNRDDVVNLNNAAKPIIGPILGSTVEGGGGSFQSFLLQGDYIYALRGTKGEANSVLRAYNITTKTATQAPFTAASDGMGREPEGLGVYGGKLAVGVKFDLGEDSKQACKIYVKG